jgi:hypothetical protein
MRGNIGHIFLNISIFRKSGKILAISGEILAISGEILAISGFLSCFGNPGFYWTNVF